MTRLSIVYGLGQMLKLEHKNNHIVAELTKAINKRSINKEVDSYDILNRFISYNRIGDDYYNIIKHLDDNLVLLTKEQIKESIVDVLKLCDDESIDKFLKFEKYTPPENLVRKFDYTTVINKEGSREQTYTQDDYVDLVKLVIKLKAVSMILVKFISIFDINVNSSASLDITRLLSCPEITEMPGYKKLVEFIEKNIGIDDSLSNDDCARVISKEITNDQFLYFILSCIVLYLGIADTPDTDNISRCLVNELYRLCKNKVAPTKSIIINNPELGIDEDGGSSAVTDTSLSQTEIPVGYVEEFLEFYGTMDDILNQIDFKINKEAFKVAMSRRDLILHQPLTNAQLSIICWIFTNTIESNYMDYFDNEIRTNFRIVAYAILVELELHSLAKVLMSKLYDNDIYIAKHINNTADLILEKEVDDIFALSVCKKSRNKKYGLSILDDGEEDEVSLKNLLINPVVKKIVNVRWSNFLTDNEDIFTLTNAREEILKLMLEIHKKL